MLVGSSMETWTPTLEGEVKSLVELLEVLLLDCGRKSGAPVRKDIETLSRRCQHEGDSFITITLPSFAADFERSLAEGKVSPEAFLHFKKTRRGIPAFLQGFLEKVFDSSGLLLANPSVDCIRSVRQICLFGKKVQRPCSQERELAASTAYRECDAQVATELSGPLWQTWGEVADLVVSTLRLEDWDDWISDFEPRHGPGATREHISGNQKWNFLRWHLRLELAGIKYWRYAKATTAPALTHSNPLPTFVDPGAEEPVRVVFVPKTLKTPRVIAVEPVCMQYVQQGLCRLLVKRIERSSVTGHSVRFADQMTNQELSRQASQDGHLATLDLSEASDRVGMCHVRRLFQRVPKFREWLEACRSTRAELPDGSIIELRKFASMGSALCFPVESLVFFVTILASRIQRSGHPVTARLVRKMAQDVHVYGDDLIVPADEAPLICSDIEALGFKVNSRKSFWTGQFRESCGSDNYAGEDVKPTYLRRDLPEDRADRSGLLSAVATANQLFKAGYFRTYNLVKDQVERIFGKLPQVREESAAIGWHAYSEASPPKRWNKDLQRLEERHLVPVPTFVPDSLDGSEQALAKCHRLIGLDVKIDTEHLERSVRPYALALKHRWVPLH